MSELFRHGVEQNGHAIMTVGPHTGHMYQAIAYCKDSATAKQIIEAINACRETK